MLKCQFHTKLRHANIENLTNFLVYLGQTGSMPMDIPFNIPEFMKTEEYKLAYKCVKDTLEREVDA